MKEGWRKGRLGRLLVNFITVNFAFWTRQEREMDWRYIWENIFNFNWVFKKSSIRVTLWIKKYAFFKRTFKFNIRIFKFLLESWDFRKTCFSIYRKKFRDWLCQTRLQPYKFLFVTLNAIYEGDPRSNLRQLNIAADKRHACKYYSPCDCGEICYGWEILLSGNYRECEEKSAVYYCVRARKRLCIRFILLSDGKSAGGWLTRTKKSRKPSLLNTKESISISSGAPTFFHK